MDPSLTCSPHSEDAAPGICEPGAVLFCSGAGKKFAGQCGAGKEALQQSKGPCTAQGKVRNVGLEACLWLGRQGLSKAEAEMVERRVSCAVGD